MSNEPNEGALTSEPFGEIRNPKRRAFLTAYAKVATITRAAEAAGIHTQSHYNWLKDPEYAAAFERAKERAIDTLESEAVRRATEGDYVLKFTKAGEMIYVPLMDADGRVIPGEDGKPQLVPYREHRKSDILLMFWLKSADPQRFRDNLSVAVKREFDEKDLARFAEQHGLARLTHAFDAGSGDAA